MIQVNGAKVTNLSVSQYALLRTMAEKFTLSNSQSVKQREVLEQTALLLTVLVAERPEWFNDAERKAWSKQAKANTLEKSGENRQLWTEVKGKLWSTPNASPLLSVLPDRGTRGGFKLQIQSSQVGFRS